MLPVEPLITEHRLIERMIALMGRELQNIAQGKAPNAEFIQTAVDFIKTYADQVHHGKEENILFRELAKKQLSPEHKTIMEQLIKEHTLGRGNTTKLALAHTALLAGDQSAVKAIIDNMSILVKFYPVHIEKEDKRFFLPVMDYFTKQEQASMLAEFEAFDRQFVHTTYKNIVSEWENK